MNYSLGNMLGGGFVGGLDPDAKGYIDAVVAAGGTVSGTQKSAINTFYKTGKSDGWYSSLKRLYLPIWAAAAPNAIDMIGLTSGTFNGTVTHTAGYVQGDGITGYFDLGISPGGAGLSLNNAGVFALVTAENPIESPAVSATYIASRAGSTSSWLSLNQSATGVVARVNDGNNTIEVYSDSRGIHTGQRINSTENRISRRDALGRTTNLRSISSSVLNSTATLFAMSSNANGVTLGYSVSTYRYGSYGFNLGMTNTQDSDFTLALKNLWEEATNLVLP
jgi:hypothetical protein